MLFGEAGVPHGWGGDGRGGSPSTSIPALGSALLVVFVWFVFCEWSGFSDPPCKVSNCPLPWLDREPLAFGPSLPTNARCETKKLRGASEKPRVVAARLPVELHPPDERTRASRADADASDVSGKTVVFSWMLFGKAPGSQPAPDAGLPHGWGVYDVRGGPPSTSIPVLGSALLVVFCLACLLIWSGFSDCSMFVFLGLRMSAFGPSLPSNARCETLARVKKHESCSMFAPLSYIARMTARTLFAPTLGWMRGGCGSRLDATTVASRSGCSRASQPGPLQYPFSPVYNAWFNPTTQMFKDFGWLRSLVSRG